MIEIESDEKCKIYENEGSHFIIFILYFFISYP